MISGWRKRPGNVVPLLCNQPVRTTYNTLIPAVMKNLSSILEIGRIYI
jgi:hypothetical protein